MKRFVASLLTTGILLGLSAPALASTALPDGAVNVRSGPGTQYSVVAVLTSSQKVSVLSHDGDWLKVKLANGTVGYMADWVTYELFDDATVYVRVDTDILNVRTAPSLDAAVLGKIYQDQQFRAVQRYGDWYQVEAGSLGTGWVAAQYIAQLPVSSPQPQPVPEPDPLPPLEPAPQPQPQPDPSTQVPTQPAALTKAAAAAGWTSMRTGRDPGYDPVASVQPGEMLTYLQSAEGWVKVMNARGAQGWVPGDRVFVWDSNLEFARRAAYGVAENDWRIEYRGVREVIAGGDGLRLYSAPGTDATVLTQLKAGDKIKLKVVPTGEFVQVEIASGQVGWLSRNFLKPVPGLPTEFVRLTQPQSGVQRLEINGTLDQSVVSVSGTTLTVSLPANQVRNAALQVAQDGMQNLTLDGSSLKLSFDKAFGYQVVEKSATRLVIEVRPQIAKVETMTGVDRVTYRFSVTGTLLPVLGRETGGAALAFPGARLVAGVTVPSGLTLSATTTGLVARVATDRPFAIKRGAGYVDLVVYAPGLAGKRIVVDPGHGGIETGAIGRTGLLEKVVNLDIAARLVAKLKAAGADVIMTRTGDTRCATPEELAGSSDPLHVDLGCRSSLSNTQSADAFISVHNNANPSMYESGTETYFSSDNLNAVRSREMATFVQKDLVATLQRPDRGVRDNIFYVTKYTDAPAILAEVAFLSHGWEETLLKTDAFRQQAADAIFRGVERFFAATTR